jgi:prepilin-type N-terminal cleavage/methylation domain-containing protein
MGKAGQVWRLTFHRHNEPPTKTGSASTPPAGPAFRSRGPRSRVAGFSLIELLVVIAIVAALAGAIVTQTRPNIGEGLRSTAQVVAADMDRARELAVAGSSSYRITFDVAGNSYQLTHTGADSRLDTLPPSPFGDSTDPPTQWTQKLGDLPRFGSQVTLHGVIRRNAVNQTMGYMEYESLEETAQSYVEFGPLGETTQSEPTVIWLASGSGDARRFISVTINPVTGVSSIGELQATSP